MWIALPVSFETMLIILRKYKMCFSLIFIMVLFGGVCSCFARRSHLWIGLRVYACKWHYIIISKPSVPNGTIMEGKILLEYRCVSVTWQVNAWTEFQWKIRAHTAIKSFDGSDFVWFTYYDVRYASDEWQGSLFLVVAQYLPHWRSIYSLITFTSHSELRSADLC